MEIQGAGKKHEMEAVIFDMDGLLFDTEQLFVDQAAKVERALGWVIPMEVHEKAVGRSPAECARIFREALGEEFPYDEYISRTLRGIEEYIEKRGVPVKPGADELLNELEGRGVPRALASSAHIDEIYRNLDALGWRGRFGFIIGGDQVERGKPDPALFLRAAERLGVPPEKCIVLEDSASGIKAAYNAGMRGILVPDWQQPAPETEAMAFLLYKDLFAVKDNLVDIMNGN